MDEELLALLAQFDWAELVGKLTLAALNQLKLCGMSRDREGNDHTPSASHPQGYAIDALYKVHQAALTGTCEWKPERGDLYPFLERLVRRLVTDDKKKYSKRLPALSYEALEPTPAMEHSSSIYLTALYEAADKEVQELILVLDDQVDSRGKVHWGDVREQLGVSKYDLGKRRERLALLMEQHDLFVPVDTIQC